MRHQPKPWLGAERLVPLPAPYAPVSECFATSCPPPPPPPPTPPLYLPSNELFRVPDPARPLMTAIPETAGQKVSVDINGTIVTSAYVVADQPQGYLKANDANIDLAPSADGAVGPTSIARHATLSARIPVSYVNPVTGRPLALERDGRARTGAIGPLHRAGSGPDAAPPSCGDPDVANAPLLGSFPDPARIGSTLGDLGLGGGPAVVHLINGQVVVCVDVTLPTEPCDGPSAGFTVKATLLADQTGLAVRDLNAHLDCAIIAGVVFQDVDFRFDSTDKRWSASGTVESIPGLPLRGGVEFAHGDFAHAFAAAKPVALNLGFLRLHEVGFDVFPDCTTGHVQFGSIFHVPYIDADPLAIDAGYVLNWGATPPYFEANGKVAVFGAPTAGGAVRVFDDGTVTGHAHFHASIAGAFSADADVGLDFWRAAPLRFDVDGNGSVSVFDLVSESGEVVASDNGAGVCVGTFWGHVGIVVHANGSIDAWPFGDCDISRARDVRPAAADAASIGRRSRAATTIAFRVLAGGARLLVGVKGAGGPPAFSLTGPGGVHVDVPASGVRNNASSLVFHDRYHGITYVGLSQAARGTWHVTAAPGSPELTEVRTGTTLRPVAVRARVVRSGRRYRLLYAGPKVLGQAVRFLERGGGSVAVIGLATGGGRGSLPFTPRAGDGMPRTIVAVITQDGRPRAVRSVGTFRTPLLRRPARPSGLRLTRSGSRLLARWRPVRGATRYLVAVRSGDGRTPVIATTRTIAVLPGFAPASAATIEVEALAGHLRGPAARATIAAQRFTLRVAIARSSIPKSARAIDATITLDVAARVELRLLNASLNTAAHVVKRERAGAHKLALPLGQHGHRPPPGVYTLLVSAEVPGLQAQTHGFEVVTR